MPRINLLPTRAAARLEAVKQEMALIAGAFVFVLFALYLWHGVTQNHIEDSTEKSATLGADLTDLKKKVSQIETFKTEAAVLEKKLAAIDKLAKSRSGPVAVLDGLSRAINNEPKIWLTRLIDINGLLTLEGGAMEQEDVSRFHLALEAQDTLFKDVKLTAVNTEKSDQTVNLTWVMTCTPVYEAS